MQMNFFLQSLHRVSLWRDNRRFRLKSIIRVENLGEHCLQRKIRFLSRSFKKSFSAFTFSLNRKNDVFGVMPNFG